MSESALKGKKRSQAADIGHDADVHAWSFEQARLLRAGLLDRLDALNIADEIEDVGHSQYDKLQSGLTIVQSHVLKWDFQPGRRSRSGVNTIVEHRQRALRQLARTPSLRHRVGDAFSEAYDYARRQASSETDLDVLTFPMTPPWSWDDLVNRDFTWNEAL